MVLEIHFQDKYRKKKEAGRGGREGKGEREEEKGRVVCEITQGRTFTYFLFKVIHSLAFLSKPSGLLEKKGVHFFEP